MKAKIMVGGNLLSDELHRDFKKPRKYLKVKVFGKDEIWSADLVQMPSDIDKKIESINLY